MWLILVYTTALLIILKLVNLLKLRQCESNLCLAGKTAIVTGGNSGIGLETVMNLASRDCKVIIADVVDSQTTVTRVISETGNTNIHYRYINLTSMKSVRKFAEDICQTEDRVDLLINNAGCSVCTGYSEDGLTNIMQVNYLGHFLLTHLLLGLLKKSQNSRVIFVSSILAYMHNLKSADQLNKLIEPTIAMLSPMYMYGNTKMCVTLATKIFASKLQKHGIACFSVHPGIINTGIFSEFFQTCSNLVNIATRLLILVFGISVRQGAQTTLHCALSDKLTDKSGKFFSNCHVFPSPPYTKNVEFAQQIWKESEKLCKLKPDEIII